MGLHEKCSSTRNNSTPYRVCGWHRFQPSSTVRGMAYQIGRDSVAQSWI